MRRFKVIFYYKENKPPISDKVFEISYEVDSTDERGALADARRKFSEYENSSYASWIRTIIEDRIRVIPEIEGKLLSEYPAIKILSYLEMDDPEIVLRVVEAIKWDDSFKKNPAIISQLNELVKKEDVHIRMSCIETLRKIDDSGTAENLVSMLNKETSVKIRASIIAIIGERGMTDMIAAVKEHLSFDDDRVRANAVEAIQKIGSEEDIVDLFPLIDDPNNRVKANVMTALWKLGKFYRIEKIAEMLGSENALMRSSAVYALGEIKSVECIRLLEKHLGDSSNIVRKNIITSLKKIQNADSLSLLIRCLNEKDPELNDYLYETILSFGERCERPLILALREKELNWGAYRLLNIIKKQKLSEGKVFDWLYLAIKCFL